MDVPCGRVPGRALCRSSNGATRRKQFQLIAKTRLSRAVLGSVTQIGLGLLLSGPFGLLLGYMLYNGMGVIGLIRAFARDDRHLFAAVSTEKMVQAVRNHKQYPLLTTPSYLFNIAAIQLPIMFIAATLPGPEAGYIMMAMQVLGIPMALVGAAVAQVYAPEAAERLRGGTLPEFTEKIMWNLFKVGAPALIVCAVVAPTLFPIVFGQQWQRAGELIVWMTPWFILQFVASPIAMVLFVTNNQLGALLLQFTGLVLRLGAVVVSAFYAPEWLTETYAVTGALFYGLYLLVVRWVARAAVSS